MGKNLSCGIDIGSTTTEIVVLDKDKKLIFADRTLTAGNVKKASELVFEKCLKEHNLKEDDFDQIIATGYGRKYVHFSTHNVTEISCYARGANYVDPDIKTVIDIGGQDSKVISITEKGDVNDFVMNDKCAAGTGRFLEMIAKTFGFQLSDLGTLALQSDTIIPISSICAVFAESEVISLTSQGHEKKDIINSIHHSIGERVHGMASRLTVEEKIMFCGGVAANVGMIRTLKQLFEIDELIIPENVEIIGAIGAAMYGFN